MMNGEAREEKTKRRRELWLIFGLGFLFLILTWLQIKILGISQELPFGHSIFFFGLVNFNIILFLLLVFLIFRNIVKVFSEKQGRLLGRTLKSKLIAAFVSFSFIPTLLMFLISVFYINNSFEKWFSLKVAGVLKNSLDITNTYYLAAKRKNYHFAYAIARDLARLSKTQSKEKLTRFLMEERRKYNLDAVEFYPDVFKPRLVFASEEEAVPSPPPISVETLERAVDMKVESSTVQPFTEGNLIRVVVPVQTPGSGAIVVSAFMPLSLISKVEDISSAYEDFRDLNPLEYPVKSIYLIILVLMTLVILLCATWFGFYLAKQLSLSLEELGRAAGRVAKGDYRQIDFQSASQEVNHLIQSFNDMAKTLGESERRVLEANRNLQYALETLDEHTKYNEVVLSNVSTGVISIDHENRISMINRYAEHLLKINAGEFIGRSVEDVLPRDRLQQFHNLISAMKEHRSPRLQKEIRIEIQGENVPFQFTLTALQDEKGQEIGKVIVFDDLTMLLNVQRAAAWKEVARRIAHEIKNPLTPIKLSAERLQKKFGPAISDPAFNESTAVIIKQVDELKNMVNEFSNFARLPQLQTKVANFNQTVEEAALLYRDAHKDIEFLFTPALTLPDFRFDPEQIKRVVNNLLDNAVSALSNCVQKQIVISIEFDATLKIARLTVVDNGPGIPLYLKNRIFEPYVTSKREGSGLGLSIVKRIVEDHNGFIRVVSGDPMGTRMIVEFPVSEASELWSSTETAERVQG